MVKDTIGSPPGEVGVNMYMECDTYSIQCFDAVGRDEIWPVKSWFVGGDNLPGSLYVLRAPVVTTTSIILSSNKIQNGDILVPTYPGFPGKMAVKRV